MKPGLLVSIRSVAEARLLGNQPLDIVDLKEPAKGSLGRLSPRIVHKILQQLPGGSCISLSLGELSQYTPAAMNAFPLESFNFLKIGLAFMASQRDWRGIWQQCSEQLPAHVKRVAVAYVDYQQCDAPPIQHVIATAVDLECSAVLLDTYNKSNGNLFRHICADRLQQIVTQVQSMDMLGVVAGSISIGDLPQTIAVGPDFVGVRGAICRQDRAGAVDKAKLTRFVNQFHVERTKKQTLLSNSSQMASFN